MVLVQEGRGFSLLQSVQIGFGASQPAISWEPGMFRGGGQNIQGKEVNPTSM